MIDHVVTDHTTTDYTVKDDTKSDPITERRAVSHRTPKDAAVVLRGNVYLASVLANAKYFRATPNTCFNTVCQQGLLSYVGIDVEGAARPRIVARSNVVIHCVSNINESD